MNASNSEKPAVRPSLLEQKVKRLIDAGMSREDAIAKLAADEAEARRTAVVDELTAKDPRILKPCCPGCGADPLQLKRLRYEFGDGVIAEILFCHNPECRISICGQIVFIPMASR